MKPIYKGVLFGQITFILMLGVSVFSVFHIKNLDKVIANQGIMFIDSVEAHPVDQRTQELIGWFKYYESNACRTRGAAAVYYQAIIKYPELEEELKVEIPEWVAMISKKYYGVDVMDL